MKEPVQFEVNGVRYRARPMDLFTQGFCLKRIIPLFVGIGQTPDVPVVEPDASPYAMRLDPTRAFEPFAKALGRLSDEDMTFVMKACLLVTDREQKGQSGWSPLWIEPGGFMYENSMTLFEVLQVVGKVLGAFVLPFLPGLGSNSEGPTLT